jgi:3-(3-hydroxy-phenyl)propionate hydroxylase
MKVHAHAKAQAENSTEYDVAIVGFGPTGAVAAGLLGAQGVRVLVCDKAQDVYNLPRAFSLDHEIMRVFQQLGVAEQVLQHTEPFTPSEFYGVDGQLIKRFTTVEPPYPLGYVPSLVFSQPPVERILREHVQSLPSVEVALGCELLQLAQDTAGATLQLRNLDGTTRQVRARYVIGCDGASSTVRSAVGIGLQDLGFDQAWLVVDVLVNECSLSKLPQTSVQYCEPKRPCTFLIGPKNHRRWEIALNAGEDPKQVATPEGTWALLSRWITPDDASLWRQATYRFHALVADSWQSGCIFVAGDAAHQQPPFLGQGMCQGIRDAVNVSWKLSAVLRGEAAPELLASYGVERRMHVTELTTRIKAVGQIVGQRDVAKARERDAHLLAECGGVVKSVPRQNVQPALTVGLLSPQPHAARGSIFPQPWIAQGDTKTLLDTLAGTGWRVVVSAAADKEVLLAAVTAHRPHTRVVNMAEADVQEADGVLERWFAQHACAAAIVRPDNYVYGVASSAQELVTQLAALHAAY